MPGRQETSSQLPAGASRPPGLSPSRLAAVTGAFRSTTGAIVLILVLRSVSLGAVGLVLPLYFDAIGRSAGQWGLASGAFALSLTFAEPLWGWASDRLGITVPFLVAGLGSALLAPVFALTGHPAALLAIQFGRGAVEFAYSPGSRKALAHSLGPGRKAVGIGLFQACGVAGGAIGPLLGSFALGRGGYLAAFLACSVVSLVATAVTLANRGRLVAVSRSEAPRPLPAPRPVESEAAHSRSPRAFAALAVIAACLFAGSFSGRTFMPLLGIRVYELRAGQVAAVLAVTGMLAGPLTILMGRLADLWGRKPLIAGGLLCTGAALLGYAFLGGFAGLAACTILLSLGFAAAVPAGVALVSDVTPYENQGRMIGLYGACENVGIMVGPMLCGFLWDAAGYRLAFTVCALLALLGMAASLYLREDRSQVRHRATSRPASQL